MAADSGVVVAPSSDQAKVTSPVSTPSTGARFVPERKDDFAWENDLVAFRTYGPAILPKGKRGPDAEDSGIDCWSKRVRTPIIDKWYADGKYHKDQGEGVDLYKVGSSRGCGGTAIWKDGKMWLSGPFTKWEVISNKPNKSVFALTYDYNVAGEEIQEVKRISITLGQQMFLSESTFTSNGKPASVDVAIGVTMHDGKGMATYNAAEGWMSYWEEIDGTHLGTGAKIDPKRVTQMEEYKGTGSSDRQMIIVTHTDADGQVLHYAGFGWDKAGEITSMEKWNDYLSKLDLGPQRTAGLMLGSSPGSRLLPIGVEEIPNGYTEVIPTAETEPATWHFATSEPAQDWAKPDFDDQAWSEGKSLFGTEKTPGTQGRLHTVWDSSDIWIRRAVQLPELLDARQLRLKIHHDNHAEVYIDGVLAWHSKKIETRDYSVFEISPEAQARLTAGAEVVLAAHCHNGSGGQAFDVGLVSLK